MVKVIPKEETKTEKSRTTTIFFWLSVLIFFIVTGLFFLFDWQIKRSEASLAKLMEEESETLGTKEQRALEETLRNYEKKLNDVVVVLNNHETPTKIFEILEEVIYQGARFSSIQFTNEPGKMRLGGEADDMYSVAQQILLLEEKEEIEEVNLLSADLIESGRISFKVEVILPTSALLIQ